MTPRDFAAQLKSSPKRVIAAIVQAVGTASLIAEDQVRRNLRGRVLQRRSGNLERTLKTRLTGSGRRVAAVLSIGSPSVPYARIHEEGGTILPKRGKYLVFKGSRGWAKVTKVTIPARPFLGPAVAAGNAWLQDNLARVVGEAV